MLLPEPLAATELLAALDGGFVLRYDCSDSLFEKGGETQGHAVNLGGQRSVKKEKKTAKHRNESECNVKERLVNYNNNN